MSVSQAEIQRAVDRYAAAWLSGELSAIVACYHDAFTLHYFGRNALSGDHVGKAAALKALAEFTQRTKRRLLGIVATAAGAERGTVIAREALTVGGKTVEVERVLVYTVANGLLRECWVYDQDQRLIDDYIDST